MVARRALRGMRMLKSAMECRVMARKPPMAPRKRALRVLSLRTSALSCG